MASRRGDYALPLTLIMQQSLEIKKELKETEVALPIRSTAWGIVASAQGDYASARAYQEESLALFREIGDRSKYGRHAQQPGECALYSR